MSLISHSFPTRLLPFSPPLFTFFFFLFLSLCPISFTQAVPCFVSHLETQAASNSNIFQQQVLAKALAATRSGPQTALCYWVNKGQLESWRNEHSSRPPTESAKGVGIYILVFWNATDWQSEYIIHLVHNWYGPEQQYECNDFYGRNCHFCTSDLPGSLHVVAFSTNHHGVGELLCSMSPNKDKDQSHPILPELTHSRASQSRACHYCLMWSMLKNENNAGNSYNPVEMKSNIRV